MSRSNPDTYAENPATRFFEWSGSSGEVVYYDRDKKENVSINLPFRFLVLDEVATVGGGYDDNDKFIGYWSNAIRPRDAKVKPFVVRASVNGKSRVEATGIWSEIKNRVTGAKYVKGLYIAFYGDDGTLQLGYLKVRGAALMPWVEFTKEHKNIYAGAFSITGKLPKKKGRNDYFEPTFAYTENIKEETNQAALMLDADVLQPYLAAYFAQDIEPSTSGAPEYSGDDHDEIEERKAIAAGAGNATNWPAAEFDEPPF